jgi:hypothetical protein
MNFFDETARQAGAAPLPSVPREQSMGETVRIVHLSDLHFGTSGQLEIWRSLRNYVNDVLKPHLVLVTGDIVDSPDESLYREARHELDLLRVVGEDSADAYRVCPGNHDRHPSGVARGSFTFLHDLFGSRSTVPAWFDQTFGGVAPTAGKPADFDLSAGSVNWRVKVIGFDSSVDAKYAAQGYARPDDLGNLVKSAKAATDFDLVILMHHHHLLPIKELERGRQSAKDLLQSTTMLNAGTVLEAVTRGHINLVLHGHQHQRAIARYGTMDGRENEVVVIGVGSATGNKTLDGCDFARCSFNVIDLHHDRSVLLREVRHDGIQWQLGNRDLLLDDRAVRRARFYRRTHSKATPTSRMLTCLEFHRDRNINFTRYWTNWAVESGQWSCPTTNSSGWPSSASIEFDWADSEREAFESVRPLKDTSDYHKHQFAVTLRESRQRIARQITAKFQWQGGGILTQDDLKYLDLNMLGPYRRQGFEFASVRAHNDLETLSLLVRIPPEFAPNLDQIQVFFEEPNGEPKRGDELVSALRRHCSGMFSFDLAYPRRGYRYVLAWRPVDDLPLNCKAEHFRKAARSAENAEKLVSAFAAELRRCLFFEPLSIALYVPLPEDRSMLTKVGQVIRDGIGPNLHPPMQLPLRGASTLHRHAWWGQIQAALAGRGDTDRVDNDAGFVLGERALVVVPIREYHRKDSISWGLIRIGIDTDSVTSDEQLLTALDPGRQEGFANALVAVLHSTLQLG